MSGFPGDLWPFQCSDERVYFIFVLQRDPQIQFYYFFMAIDLSKKRSDVIVWREEKKIRRLSRKNNQCHISLRHVALFLPAFFPLHRNYSQFLHIMQAVSRRTTNTRRLLLTASENKVLYYCCLKSFIYLFIYLFSRLYNVSTSACALWQLYYLLPTVACVIPVFFH